MQPAFHQAAGLVAKASQALQQGRVNEAGGLAQQALEVMPDNASALHVLALAHNASGRTDMAVDLLRRAISIDGKAEGCYVDLGNMLGAAGQIDDAKAVFKKGVKKLKNSVQLMFELGRTHLMLREYKEALTILSKVARLAPDVPQIQSMLGVAQQYTGRPKAAVESYKRALELGSNNPTDHFNLGAVLQGEQDYEGAIAAFEKAVELNPKFQRAYHNIGSLKTRATDYAGAIDPLRRALAIDPKDLQAANDLAYCLSAIGETPEAIGICEQLIRVQPKSAGNHNQHAFALLCAGEPEKALEACDRALEFEPGNTRSLAFKSAAFNELNRRGEAAEILDFQRLLSARMLDVPEGFDSIDAFNAELVKKIYDHPSLRYSDMNRSLAFGQGTLELFDGSETGAMLAFRKRIYEVVDDYIKARPKDPDHPFLLDPPRKYRVTCWASVMDSQGFHSVHFHPPGWLSGVYYPLLPGVVKKTESNHQEGWIEFGRAYSLIGSTDNPPVELVQPREGLVVLFPSYFGHQTIPFEGDEKRISVAFDVERLDG